MSKIIPVSNFLHQYETAVEDWLTHICDLSVMFFLQYSFSTYSCFWLLSEVQPGLLLQPKVANPTFQKSAYNQPMKTSACPQELQNWYEHISLNQDVYHISTTGLNMHSPSSVQFPSWRSIFALLDCHSVSALCKRELNLESVEVMDWIKSSLLLIQILTS